MLRFTQRSESLRGETGVRFRRIERFQEIEALGTGSYRYVSSFFPGRHWILSREIFFAGYDLLYLHIACVLSTEHMSPITWAIVFETCPYTAI